MTPSIAVTPQDAADLAAIYARAPAATVCVSREMYLGGASEKMTSQFDIFCVGKDDVTIQRRFVDREHATGAPMYVYVVTTSAMPEHRYTDLGAAMRSALL